MQNTTYNRLNFCQCHPFFDGHSINTKFLWDGIGGVRGVIQVFKNELYIYIHLD